MQLAVWTVLQAEKADLLRLRALQGSRHRIELLLRQIAARADEARAALAEIVTRWPEDAAFAQQLLPWALGEPGVDQAKVRAAIADTPENDASYFLIARQDVDGYNTDIESRGAILEAYYFANLYSSKPHGHAMLRDPRVKALLVRCGFPAYWREKGWPVGCRPLGEADFECGTDAAPVH